MRANSRKLATVHNQALIANRAILKEALKGLTRIMRRIPFPIVSLITEAMANAILR